MMFFMMHTLSQNKEITDLSGSLREMLNVGSVIIGVFSAIFLFYTNSFIIKRRKKEIGLYNILGMEKRHIMKVMIYETLFTSLISIVIGIICGLVFGNLIFMLLLRILQFMKPITFSLSINSVMITILVFVGVFLVTLVTNLLQIYFAKPVELLKGSNQGEREPKTKWLLAIIGFISLAAAYTIVLLSVSPLEAFGRFSVAIVLVIVGTYGLFTSGSIAILKILKKNKRFYYKQNNFISVSGMIYRMKQNAAGLANICILSAALLVTLSTTISLYVGMEDVLSSSFPQDIVIKNSYSDETYNDIQQTIESNLKEYNVSISDRVDYKCIEVPVIQNDGKFIGTESISYSPSLEWINFVPLSEFNRLEDRNFVLGPNEALFYQTDNRVDSDTIYLNEIALSVKNIENPSNINKGAERNKTMYYLIVDDSSTILNMCQSLTGEPLSSLNINVSFDVDGESDNVTDYSKSVMAELAEKYPQGSISSKQLLRESFMASYGSLFFLGIIIGLLFLMATVLIIYYKQISEGYDDRDRFKIMQKVGMSKTEVKKSIKSQVLMVFFLPLIMAIVHIAFAFSVIVKLLSLFGFTNTLLFIGCMAATTLVFIIIYGFVYAITAKSYYKIVS